MSEPLPRLAVLIDADNTSPKVAEGLFLEIAKLGEASVRRIYGDFSDDRLKGWSRILAQFAVIPHQNFAYTQGKNSADIALVIDAMDLMHTGRFDGFCLVSSDSDFTRLASRLREQGVDVYGFGQRKTPEAFRQACRRFFYIENLVAEAEAAGADPEPTAAEDPASGTESEDSPKQRKPEAPSRAVPIIRKAMEGMQDEDGWVSLGVIGQRLGNLAPDFDSRTYGSSKLSDLIRRAGAFAMEKDESNHVRVRFKPAANGAAEEPPKGKSKKKAEPKADAKG